MYLPYAGYTTYMEHMKRNAPDSNLYVVTMFVKWLQSKSLPVLKTGYRKLNWNV